METVCTAWQGGFDIEAGPVLAAGIIEGHPDGCDRLFLAAHHLAIDIVSWWILIDQLQRLYDADDASALPSTETGSLRRWSRALIEQANAPSITRELAHWTEAVSGPRLFGADLHRSGELGLERRYNLGATLFDDAARAAERLLGLHPNEVMIAAATLALAALTGERDITVAVEGHGREPSILKADLSRTVGWFTSLHPCRFRLPEASGGRDAMIEALAEIKDALRRAPRNGIRFGLLRYLSSDPVAAETLSSWSSADLSVNFLGGLDLGAGDWRLDRDSPGATVSP